MENQAKISKHTQATTGRNIRSGLLPYKAEHISTGDPADWSLLT